VRLRKANAVALQFGLCEAGDRPGLFANADDEVVIGVMRAQMVEIGLELFDQLGVHSIFEHHDAGVTPFVELPPQVKTVCPFGIFDEAVDIGVRLIDPRQR
jgi:hypothetical protein